MLERWFTPSFSDLRRYREMLVSTSDEGYARCCEALREWDVRGTLGAIAAPTLLVAGDEDPSTPPAELEAIGAEIPEARLVLLRQARHLANGERSGELNPVLVEHLA